MANLPTLAYTLVAEQIRPETGMKMTILGFIGASPEASLLVPSFPTPINFAMLMMFAPTTTSGSFPIKVGINGPKGVVLEPIPGPEGLRTEMGKFASMAINFQMIQLPDPGRYTVGVYSEDRLEAEASFLAGTQAVGMRVQ